MTRASENGLWWQRVFRWDTPGQAGTLKQGDIYSELLLRASGSSKRAPDALSHTHTHTYVCPWTHVHKETGASRMHKARTDHQCDIKVIESWQISAAAAAESLTWGCWIDNPSMGTMLAFSSFWVEQNESRVVQMLLHPRQISNKSSTHQETGILFQNSGRGTISWWGQTL